MSLLGICPKACVQIGGLKSKRELNERRGTVLAFFEDSGRWSVRIDGEDGTRASPVLVKPENLTPVLPEFETVFLSKVLPGSARGCRAPPDFLSEAIEAFLGETQKRRWPKGMCAKDRNRAEEFLRNGIVGATALRWGRTLSQCHRPAMKHHHAHDMHSGALKLGDVMMDSVSGHDFDTFTTNFGNAPPSRVQMTMGGCHVAVGFNDLRVLLDAGFTEADGILSFVGIDLNPYCVAKSLVVAAMLRQGDVPLKHICQVWYSSTWTEDALASFRQASAAAGTEPDVAEPVLELLQFWQAAKSPTLTSARERWIDFFSSEGRKWDASWLANLSRAHDRIAAARYYVTGELHTDGDKAEVGSVTMWSLPKGLPPVLNADSIFATMRIEDIAKSDTYTSGGDICAAFASYMIGKLESARRLLLGGRLEISLWLEEVSLDNPTLLKRIREKRAQTISWSNIADYLTRDQFHALAKACCSMGSPTVHHVYSMEWVKEVYGIPLCDWSRQGRQTARASILKSLEVGLLNKRAAEFGDKTGVGGILDLPGLHCPGRFWMYVMAMYYHGRWVDAFVGSRPDSFGVSFDMLLPVILHRRFPTNIYLQWSYAPGRGGDRPPSSRAIDAFDAAFRADVAGLIQTADGAAQ